jgi:hypothetical protein
MSEIRPEIQALVERGRVTTDEVNAFSCSYSEWAALVPAMTDEAFADRVERALGSPQGEHRPPGGEPIREVYAPELLRRFKAAAREANAFAETIDNVRAALSQKETHYLVIADDVKELVEAVELCASDGGCRAMTVLRRLREGT